jgi:hypothetical protein
MRWRSFVVCWFGISAVLALVSLATVALAQPAPPTPPSTNETLAAIITALSAILVSWATYGVRRAIPRIPRIALPFVVMALGTVAAYVDSLITGGQFSVIGGAALGAAALWLREVISTFNEHGFAAAGPTK